MKFHAFDYTAPASLGEAVEALASDEDAKVLAGGQSLLPLMALRLACPSVLVDLQHLGLDALEAVGGELRIGAMTRHRALETDPVVRAAAPLLAEAVTHVGHGAIRNRGTLGGSLAHADPAAELPAVAVALGAEAVVSGPAGVRRVRCADLADGYFSTTLGPGEIVTEIVVPAAAGRHGASWCEWAPRAGDFAEAGVGVAVELDPSGACARVMAAACGVAPVPADLGPRLSALLAGVPDPGSRLLGDVADLVRAACRPGAPGPAGSGPGDAPGPDDAPEPDSDRAELAGLLAARAVKRAFDAARRVPDPVPA